MKKIKIVDRNGKIQAGIDALQNEIEKVEGKATCRCISAEYVASKAVGMVKKLDFLEIPYKARKGTSATASGSETLAKSYGHTAYATYAFLEIGSDGKSVYVTEVCRSYNGSPYDRMQLSEEAKNAFDWIVKNGIKI